MTERTPSTAHPVRLVPWVAGLLSALIPGLGQLVRGRFADAALCLVAATWIHGFFAGLAMADERADPVAAALGLAFGLPQGFGRPVAVVFTTLGLALHAFAAWDALDSGGRGRHDRPDEAGDPQEAWPSQASAKEKVGEV